MADSHISTTLDLKALEAFVFVAEHGSFTRAAELLQSDQPALSRLVRRLEVELHHTLLVRHGRGAAPTPAGELLLAHGREILAQVQKAQNAMQLLNKTDRQKFTLGLVPNIAKFSVLSLVREMRAQFPRVAIKVVEGLSSSLLESLLMERIDAAVIYETPRSDLIDKRTLMREELYFISAGEGEDQDAPVGRIRFKDVAKFPLVLSSRTHAIREVVETQAAKLQLKLDVALEVDAVPSLLDLVEEGYGHALLPMNALVRDGRKRNLSIKRVTDPTLYCKLVLATSRRNPPTGFGRNALSLLEERIVQLYVAQDSLHSLELPDDRKKSQ